MKFGISTYSFVREITSKRMSVLDVLRFVKQQGGEHVEIVPFGFDLTEQHHLCADIRQEARALGLDISNYCVLSDFTQDDEGAYEEEITRVLHEVDIARQLGAGSLRFDVAWRARRPDEEAGLAGVVYTHNAITADRFEHKLDRIAAACARIADYAHTFNIVTTIENHLYFVQASERVQRVIRAVDRPYFRTTLDTGNFLCVDESPLVGVTNNIDLAAMIHLKDFYVRSATSDPGEGWFRSAYGTYLRGAIFGNGDIDTRQVLSIIRNAGYAGYASIEFEGVEDSAYGTRVSLDNARRIWSALDASSAGRSC